MWLPCCRKIERGDMVVVSINGECLAPTLVLCTSKNIALANEVPAVQRLTMDAADDLCYEGRVAAYVGIGG